MIITGWDNSEIIKVLMAHKKISQKKLLEILSENSEKKIPQSTFANRIFRNSMRLRELQEICEVLGYDLILEPKNNKKREI